MSRMQYCCAQTCATHQCSGTIGVFHITIDENASAYKTKKMNRNATCCEGAYVEVETTKCTSRVSKCCFVFELRFAYCFLLVLALGQPARKTVPAIGTGPYINMRTVKKIVIYLFSVLFKITTSPRIKVKTTFN